MLVIIVMYFTTLFFKSSKLKAKLKNKPLNTNYSINGV